MSAKCIPVEAILWMRGIVLINKIPLKLTPKMLQFNWRKPPKACNFSNKFHEMNLLPLLEFMTSKKFFKS